MRLKKKLLQKSRLYLILDREVNSHSELFEIALKAIKGGVDIIQLRDKLSSDEEIVSLSRRLVKLTHKKNVLFVLNDRPDLALKVKADGVHLGQDDGPIKTAKKILGKDFLIGISCQNAVHLEKAQQEGADYIGFGSIFKTKTKPQRKPLNVKRVGKIISQAAVPVFAIGGISIEKCSELVKVGITRVAVCRDIGEAEDVQGQTKRFVKALALRG